MSDNLFREVDEEVRREQLMKLWRKYGPFATGAAIAVVIAVVGVIGWQQYQSDRRATESARFTEAARIAQGGDLQKAAEAFATLAEESGSGYRALASLRHAAALADLGRREEAVAAFERLANDTGADELLRELARLLAAYHLIGQASLQELLARLQPLAADGRPFRYSAQELIALARLAGGETAAAKQDFAKLADDPFAPAGVRDRASEMLRALGGVE